MQPRSNQHSVFFASQQQKNISKMVREQLTLGTMPAYLQGGGNECYKAFFLDALTIVPECLPLKQKENEMLQYLFSRDQVLTILNYVSGEMSCRTPSIGKILQVSKPSNQEMVKSQKLRIVTWVSFYDPTDIWFLRCWLV